MTVSLVLSLLAPFLLGLVLLLISRASDPFFLLFSLAFALGLGISSLTYFVWLNFFGSSSHYFVFESFLIMFLVAIFLFCWRDLQRIKREKFYLQPPGTKIRIFEILFISLFIICLLAFILSLIRNPHGKCDAVAIWNMRARFIFRGGNEWENAFSTLITCCQLDYPLMLPISIVRIWDSLGAESLFVPPLLAAIFTFSTVFLLSSLIAFLRGPLLGFVAGLMLMGSRYFMIQGASEYADVPLGYFLLVTLAMFALYDKHGRLWTLFFAGIGGGLSAWTKNEGSLFLVAILIGRAYTILSSREVRSFKHQLLFFLLGLAPVFAVILYFKLNFAPPNDLLSSLGRNTIESLTDYSRYIYVLKEFFITALKITRGIPFLLAIYFFLVRNSEVRFTDKSSTGILVTIFAILFGYFFVYIMTPHDIRWHVETSLDRLIIQVWPSILFWFFLTAQAPEHCLFDRSEGANENETQARRI